MNKKFEIRNLVYVDKIIAKSAENTKMWSYTAGAVAFVIGWTWLALQSAGNLQFVEGANLGPGMESLRPLLENIGGKVRQSFWLETLMRFCVPQIQGELGGGVWREVVGLFTMWFAMAVAMMLPAAAPMLRTYADIADVAHGKGEATVPLYVLAGGYALSWAGFCGLAAMVQMWLIKENMVSQNLGPQYSAVSGGVLIAAGMYQFSYLKNACLEKCRNPFRVLFSQWKTTKIGVLRLGIEQGGYCIGCCWALMMVLFVVGIMNLAWMAFFTLLALAEKTGKNIIIQYASGGILIAWGMVLIILTTIL